VCVCVCVCYDDDDDDDDGVRVRCRRDERTISDLLQQSDTAEQQLQLNSLTTDSD